MTIVASLALVVRMNPCALHTQVGGTRLFDRLFNKGPVICSSRRERETGQQEGCQRVTARSMLPIWETPPFCGRQITATDLYGVDLRTNGPLVR